jgi:phytoene dehydrogenase-like protein/uncharacterized membrane protein
MVKKIPGTVWIFIGFVPWILYWTLSGYGLWTEAVTAGLAAVLILNAYRFRQRQLKTMELVTLAFFAAHFAVTIILGSPLFKTYSAVLVEATLAVMAWGTLLAGSPFTYQYAREDWPREYWRHPLFYRTNAVITAVWGAIFTINAVLGALALVWPEARLWLTVAVPNAAIGAGIAFSIFFPNWYPKRILAQEIAAREPYQWPGPVFGPARPAGETEHDVIVVGAGIGGLTAAALLARRGLKVLVAEQHHRPGGFCTSWERPVLWNGERLRYVFDAGVHDVSGLGPRGPVTNLLRRLEINDRLEWRRVGHEYVLPGLRLKVPGTAEGLVEAMQARFPAEREAVAAFFAEMEGVYRDLYADVERTGGVPCPPRTPEEMLAYPRTHPYAFRWMDIPYMVMLERFFQDASLKRFLLLLTGYLSDRPETLTAAQMAPLFGYYFDGGYYPVGGSQALADALAEVIEVHGGRVLLRAPVERILIEGGRAAGVILAEGQIYRAGAVISNADARKTFLKLVGREHLPPDFVRRIEGLEFSTSAFAVFLGVDFVPELEPVTLVHTEDGRGLGIMTPSRVDPGLAPPEHAAITLLTLVPRVEAKTWDRRAPDYARRKREFGDALVALAERVLPGLREHIVFREEASPATFARYAWTTGGAIYGPAGRWRPAAKSPVERLYLAGAGVFPGAGIEAVVISGTLAADAVFPQR